MTRILLVPVIICLWVVQALAQCTSFDVTIPSEVCRQSTLAIENNTLAASFEWDLCPDDLKSTPSISKVINTGLSSTLDLELAEDDEKHYGFAVDATSNSLLRLDFGNSRDNVPTKANLGNIDGQFEFPNSIAIVRQQGSWFGIVANGANGKVILLNFGNSLGNTPAGSLLYTRAGGGFANIKVASTSDEGRALLIAEYNARQVTVVNYPDGFLLPSGAQQVVSIPGSSPIDVDVVRECDQWKAMVLSFDDRKLYKLDFGSSFVDVPAVTPYDLTFGFEPYRLSVAREGDALVGFASSTSGGLSRMHFQDGVDSNPTIVSIGSFGMLSNSRSLVVDSKEGIWKAFMINFSDGDLYRLSFHGNCAVTPVWTTGTTPGDIEYSVAGTKRIAVTAFMSDGSASAAAYEVTVRDVLAPQFTIENTNSCVNHEVYFHAETTQGTIATFQWQFGDGNSSSLEAPSHLYSTSNTYDVSLTVTDPNACVNAKRIALHIFDKPVSDFILPSSTPLCTNQILTFVNTSQFEENSMPYWRWFVNSVEVSTEKDLSQPLNTPGPHSIKLIAGIPGCESQSEQALGPLTEGPMTGFVYSGVCVGEATEFVNSSSGDIEAFQWDFGDGQSSTDENPLHLFADIGEYEVELTAVGASGCSVRKSESIQIRSIPIPDFQILGPPSSCSGTPSFFENQTMNPDGGEISQWLWSFDDGTSNQTTTDITPEHTFASAGVYQVSLSASTALGCVETKQKEIVIYKSPEADFTNTEACDEIPVTFKSVSGEPVVSWYWEMGTAYYATPSPTHTFRTPGNFPVYLEVTADNGCTASMTKTVNVPQPLAPDFTVIKNCVNQEAIFNDITTGSDAVVVWQWDFGAGASPGNASETHMFTQPGAPNVTLHVTTESGCSYQKTKQVQIVPAPLAAFSASPESGAYPLEVGFTNLSSQATQFRWEFEDQTGKITNEQSPVHIFTKEGSFEVTLTAYNTVQCEHSSTRTITTLAPLPDADIELINLVPNADGTTRLIITVNNKGNTILKSLPLTIDFGGKLSLQHLVHESISPASKYNFVFSTSILDVESLPYLCVSLELGSDVEPDGNRMCKELQNKLYALPAYPNPAAHELNIEWISQSSGPLQVTLIDGSGHRVFFQQIQALGGLNRQRMHLQGVRKGLYLLVIDDGVTRNIQRIAVQTAP